MERTWTDADCERGSNKETLRNDSFPSSVKERMKKIRRKNREEKEKKVRPFSLVLFSISLSGLLFNRECFNWRDSSVKWGKKRLSDVLEYEQAIFNVRVYNAIPTLLYGMFIGSFYILYSFSVLIVLYTTHCIKVLVM